MIYTFNDGKVVDPRDLEETPGLEETPRSEPEPVIKLREPSFPQVERQDQVRPCYLCGRPSIEWADYGPYFLFMHHGCWWSMGGGWEQDRARKLSRVAR